MRAFNLVQIYFAAIFSYKVNFAKASFLLFYLDMRRNRIVFVLYPFFQIQNIPVVLYQANLKSPLIWIMVFLGLACI